MSTETGLAATRERKSRIFERHADDWYAEPSWCWTRLFERMGFDRRAKIHDPACGGGAAVEAACASGYAASGSDIEPRWLGKDDLAGTYAVDGFANGMRIAQADVIVSNPPFKLARPFAAAAIEAADRVCLLLPATWACGDTKARWLAGTPLSHLLFLTPRPTMMPGLGLLPGQKLGGGRKDFAIFVWSRGHDGPAEIGWLHRDTVEVTP
jgi:hypothetical protein